MKEQVYRIRTKELCRCTTLNLIGRIRSTSQSTPPFLESLGDAPSLRDILSAQSIHLCQLWDHLGYLFRQVEGDTDDAISVGHDDIAGIDGCVGFSRIIELDRDVYGRWKAHRGPGGRSHISTKDLNRAHGKYSSRMKLQHETRSEGLTGHSMLCCSAMSRTFPSMIVPTAPRWRDRMDINPPQQAFESPLGCDRKTT
jgi:hypothetical protein